MVFAKLSLIVARWKIEGPRPYKNDIYRKVTLGERRSEKKKRREKERLVFEWWENEIRLATDRERGAIVRYYHAVGGKTRQRVAKQAPVCTHLTLQEKNVKRKNILLKGKKGAFRRRRPRKEKKATGDRRIPEGSQDALLESGGKPQRAGDRKMGKSHSQPLKKGK